jgi:EAL domain-containing protein (putative c-di-GMP-specific phosphodiesterase class I)/GGDEF domain-containing protein
VFSRLRTKLTVLYATLFGVALLVVAVAVYGAANSNARAGVRSELAASGTVFDRVWGLRSRQLEDGATLLSRDFGFREAVASRDEATIVSALDNLRRRLGVDMAFVVGVDGQVSASGDAGAGAIASQLLTTLDEQTASGVFMIGERPYQAIAAPIMSPVLAGWVVFAIHVDRAELRGLEDLAAIPLTAEVLHQDAAGRWGGAVARPEAQALDGIIAAALRPGGEPQAELRGPAGAELVLVKPLKTLAGGRPAVLVLRFPLAEALAPYRSLIHAVVAAAALGMILLLVGSWALARSVTRPISALEEGVRQLRRGEEARVEVATRDELARLADSFNDMAVDLREREARITHQALHDAETGLPNRAAIEADVSAMARGGDGVGSLFVAAVGIDRFEHIRNAIGYGLSGRMVGEVGARLEACGFTGRVARLSTKMLGVAFWARDLDEARHDLAACIGAVEAPLELDGVRMDVSVTVGMAMLGVHGDDVATLIDRATIAFDQANGRRRKLALFDESAYGDPAANLSLMSDMLDGLARGQFSLHHQPKLDLRSGQVTGVEALVRWTHPRRGPLAPDLFIPMAEETGHIRTLTDWVLGQALVDQATMKAAGHDMAMSINISGRLLGDSHFAEAALAAVTRAAGPLCFEITETAVIDNPEVALQTIERLAQAGVAVSIDDYGSGLSSLAYLKRIRAQELKIDKAFVTGLGSSNDALLVKSTIDLAHSLGLKVTAEGVEDAAALAALNGMGCDLAQGYFIARPIPLNELLTFLANNLDEQPSVRPVKRARRA